VAETHLYFRRLNYVASAVAAFSIVATAVMAFSFVGSPQRVANAAPLSLVFESVSNTRVSLGTLASRSRCGPLTRQGVGPYVMSGVDASTGEPYSYSTDSAYTAGAQSRESGEAAPNNMSYNSLQNQTVLNRSGVLELSSSGSITFGNSCTYNGSSVTVYGSIFGPQVYTQAFQATSGQALSFDWAAVGGGDDYEVYAFLVKVANSTDYGSASTSTVLAYGRGKNQGWTTSTGLIPSDGWYRFRFVNGTYDRNGAKGVGAKMYIDPRVLVGEANNISFAALSDRVNNASNQTFTISATTSSNAIVDFTSSTTTRCTVGASTLSDGVSQATVSLVSGQIGLCTISANSASTGEFATAATVTRSFTLLAAPTAPNNSGGTSVTGIAAVGQTMTAVDGSWADGGSAIISTSYQWQSCLASSCSWANIAGAVDASIVLGSSDVGRKVRVQVTKTNGVGSTSVFSSESATVVKGDQLPLTVSSTSATFGQVLTLTTTGGSGTGAVTFAKISGTCSLAGIQLTPGDAGSACVVTATKAGDAAFNPVTSSQTSIATLRAPQLTPLVVTSTSGTFGSDLVLTSSGGSGTGAVSWSVVSGACTVSGATLTPTAAGNSCVVRATKSSDTNYLSLSSTDTTLSFARGPQTVGITVASMSLVYGQTDLLTASGGSGTGEFTFNYVSGPCTINDQNVLPTDIGVCTVSATRSGDANYLDATSAAASFSIARRPLSFVLTANNKPYDASPTATVSVGSLSGVVNGDDVSVNPNRIIATFIDDEVGQNKVVVVTLQSNLLQGADAAKYVHVVPQNPRANIVRATQTGVTFLSAESMTVGNLLQLQIGGGQSSGTTSYAVSSGDCVITGNQITASRGGMNCVVAGTKAGDSRYNPITVSQTITVNKIVQQLTVQSGITTAVVGSTHVVSVTSDAFLAPTIAIANSSASVCSISADVVTFFAPGTCLISVSQAGTDRYASAAVSQSIEVTAAPLPPSSTSNQAGATTNTPTTNTRTPDSGTQSVATLPTTTTTTTTLPPNQGDPTRPMTNSLGELPKLDVGKTTVMVRGQEVEAQVVTTSENIVLRLPNDVEVIVAPTDELGNPLAVGGDGTIRLFGSQKIRVQITGLIPGTTYTAYLFSDPVEIGRGVARADGTIDELFEVPKEMSSGSHTLQVNSVGPDAEVVSVALGISVLETSNNTRLVVALIGIAMLCALFIPLSLRRRFFGDR
jgi:hypothetical protein